MSEKQVPVKLEGTDFTNVFIAVFVILITLVIFALYKRRKSTRRGILLTGLCDSGKTVIFSQLVHNKHVDTHTSIKENVGNFILNNDVLKIIDIPGHERLRNKFFEEHKSFAKGIIFVVDSSTLQQDVRDAAEFLYNIITDAVVSSNNPSLLILCNKQDQTLAKGCNVIKSVFEKELNTLRYTKANQLESVDPKSKKNSGLGNLDNDFDFASLHIKVDFAECVGCTKNKSCSIDELKKWLIKIS